MRRFKIFLTVFLIVLFSLSSSFAGIEDSKFVLDQLLKGKENPDVALLVIDMQQRELRDAIDPIEFHYISESQNELISYSGSKKIPVINVVMASENRADEFTVLDSMIAVLEHKTYYKFGNDAFDPKNAKERDKFDELYKTRLSSSTANDGSEVISEELGDYLRSKGIKNIFLMGCFDGACVASTAEGALNEGFEVYTDRDLNLVRRLDFIVPDKTTGKQIPSSMEQCKLLCDAKWREIESIYPDTLTVLPNSPFTRPSSEFNCIDS